MTALLEGQVILITGSTAGLGATMAETFARHSAAVVITGRRLERGQEVERRIESAGGRALFVQMDMCSEDQVAAAVAAAVAKFGKLTGLVNNAAWIQGRPDAPITEIDTQAWRAMLASDLDGFFFASKHAIRAIAIAGGGSVVNMSSAAGVRGQLSGHAYTACKGAIQSLTPAMAAYYSRYNIRVNCLVAGTFDTGEGRLRELLTDPVVGTKLRQHYLGRVGEPRELADATAFLLSPAASFINGILLPVDNGATSKSHSLSPVVNMAGVPDPANDWTRAC
ncbi:MAG: SDR family oxidoreductase [Steroidobacteraceae bacterium]